PDLAGHVGLLERARVDQRADQIGHLPDGPRRLAVRAGQDPVGRDAVEAEGQDLLLPAADEALRDQVGAPAVAPGVPIHPGDVGEHLADDILLVGPERAALGPGLPPGPADIAGAAALEGRLLSEVLDDEATAAGGGGVGLHPVELLVLAAAA